MYAENTSQRVTIHRINRLRNSVNGNPRFSLFTDRGRFVTKADGMVGFEVQNLPTLPVTVIVTTTKAEGSTVWHIMRTKEEEEK